MFKKIAWFLAASLLSSPLAWANIADSPHNFSGKIWNPSGEICVVCHTPHNASSAIVPLWNHAVSAATFTPYSSATLNASVGAPSASSLACLSCHDGTVAMDSFGGQVGGSYMRDERIYLSPDMSNDHPVSFTYDAALAAADGGLHDPTTRTVTRLGGKTVSQAMLFGGKMECSSCHDVHKNKGDSPGTPELLLVRKYKSELCLTCHKK